MPSVVTEETLAHLGCCDAQRLSRLRGGLNQGSLQTFTAHMNTGGKRLGQLGVDSVEAHQRRRKTAQYIRRPNVLETNRSAVCRVNNARANATPLKGREVSRGPETRRDNEDRGTWVTWIRGRAICPARIHRQPPLDRRDHFKTRQLDHCGAATNRAQRGGLERQPLWLDPDVVQSIGISRFTLQRKEGVVETVCLGAPLGLIHASEGQRRLQPNSNSPRSLQDGVPTYTPTRGCTRSHMPRRCLSGRSSRSGPYAGIAGGSPRRSRTGRLARSRL